MNKNETRECVVHTHTTLTEIREGTIKCLFKSFKKNGGEQHLDCSHD